MLIRLIDRLLVIINRKVYAISKLCFWHGQKKLYLPATTSLDIYYYCEEQILSDVRTSQIVYTIKASAVLLCWQIGKKL